MTQVTCYVNDTDIEIAKRLGYVDLEENDLGFVVGRKEGSQTLVNIPCFTGDAQEALSLCEYMNAKGFTYSSGQILTANGAVWDVAFIKTYGDGHISGYGLSETLSEAIALAMVEALRQEDAISLGGTPVKHQVKDSHCLVELGGDVIVVPAIRKVSGIRTANTVSDGSRHIFYVHVADTRDALLMQFSSASEAKAARAKLLDKLQKFYN